MANEPSSLKPVNPLGDSQLVLAGRKGDVDQLKKIFRDLIDAYGFSKEDARNIFARHSNRLGKTVLHEAAQNSREHCVRYLVQKNDVDDELVAMDPDCLKQGDWTPLMLACTKNNLDVIRILVEAGASLGLKNKDGWTPFHIACREGHGDIVSYFLQLKSLELWRTRSKNGRTPLHTAALYGRQGVVELLLSEKAFDSVDDGDSCGSTALMDALRSGHIEIAKRLITSQANPWKIDAVGRQPIHLACQAGQEESATFLVQLYLEKQRQKCVSESFDERAESAYIVNIATSDESKSTPAHFAAKEGHVDILKLLKCFGANLDATDSKGRSPLHMASGAQRASCVDYLLSENVPDLPDCQGVCAGQLARKAEVKKVFEKFAL